MPSLGRRILTIPLLSLIVCGTAIAAQFQLLEPEGSAPKLRNVAYDYRDMVGNPKYGVLGLMVLPLGFVAIVGGAFLFIVAMVSIILNILKTHALFTPGRRPFGTRTIRQVPTSGRSSCGRICRSRTSSKMLRTVASR